MAICLEKLAPPEAKKAVLKTEKANFALVGRKGGRVNRTKKKSLVGQPLARVSHHGAKRSSAVLLSRPARRRLPSALVALSGSSNFFSTVRKVQKNKSRTLDRTYLLN